MECARVFAALTCASVVVPFVGVLIWMNLTRKNYGPKTKEEERVRNLHLVPNGDYGQDPFNTGNNDDGPRAA